MTANHNISRLWTCLFISLIIHLSILTLLFINFSTPAFKKGTATDPTMKIAGFQILGEGEITQVETTHQESSKDNSNPHSTPKTHSESTNNPTFSDISSLKLYDGKSKAPNNTQNKSRIKALEKFPGLDSITRRDIEELYGEEFGDYGLKEQNFLAQNLRDIGRITQRYLQYPRSAARLGQEGVNAVEFYLHPNGDISELKILLSSQFMLLDRNTERTIEIAYKDYPRPLSKTKIRIFVTYGINYYGY